MYKTVQGDTFENIARKKYGSEQHTNKIAAANPGVEEPLIAGLGIIVPPVSEALQDKSQQTEAETNEVTVLLNGVRFRYWDSITINRAVDSVDTVSFSAPFDVNNSEFRKAFQPFSFPKVVISVSGEPLFTGTLIDVSPNLTTDQQSISVNAYSLPGVLEDCTPSDKSFPLEFNNQTLEDIAKKLLIPFGIGVDFNGDAGQAAFKKVACEPTERIFGFLTKLAKQKGLLISSTSKGNLLFTKATEQTTPIAIFKQGEPPLLNVSADFNPQTYYSHITGIESTKVGKKGAKYTEKNPHIKTLVRPLTFTASDIKSGELKQAVLAKMGRMFADMVSYTILVPTWRDNNNELWEPNKIISLTAPSAMIYKEYKLLIRSVVFTRQSDKEEAQLDLVIPQSFNNKIPENLPWVE